MNRLDFAHTRSGGYGLVVLALTIALAFSGACSTPVNNDDKPVTDEVIGKPPAADEDPFFVQKMPGEAVEAAPTGSIGDEEGEFDRDGSTTEEGGEVASRAPDSTDRRSDQSPDRSQASEQPQCFSCVRICPTEGDCDQAKDDVICGWGVHETADQARRMAKAECDATLDMARQMPVWSEIAGECPAATCR